MGAGGGWLNNFFVIGFLKILLVSETFLHLNPLLLILHDLFMNFPLLKTYEKILGESLLKCKNKRNLYIVCSLSQSSYPWYKFHILQRSFEKKSSNFGDYFIKWKLTIPHRFRQFWQYLSCNFEKKSSFGSICSVSRRRKEIKVIVSFRPHTGRFTVGYKEYGNTLFSYFDFFIYVSSNFTLDSKIAEYLQCHISLQPHTCFINFDLVKFKKKYDKKQF